MARRMIPGFLFLLGVFGCSSGGGAEPSTRERDANEPVPAADEAPETVRYQFVETPGGMAVEAVSESEVLTFSCPTRTCAGLCDECAAAACRASEAFGAACEALVAQCNEGCNCGAPDGPGFGCGFPVCVYDARICYVGDDESPLDPSEPPRAPGDPAPDPGSAAPAGRPSDPSGARPVF